MTVSAFSAIECEGAISDQVLQAARAAMPKDPSQWFLHAGVKNSPQLALLIALLEAAQAVAKAVADNAWDDSLPVPSDLATDLARLAQSIASDITNATQCPVRSEA